MIEKKHGDEGQVFSFEYPTVTVEWRTLTRNQLRPNIQLERRGQSNYSSTKTDTIKSSETFSNTVSNWSSVMPSGKAKNICARNKL